MEELPGSFQSLDRIDPLRLEGELMFGSLFVTVITPQWPRVFSPLFQHVLNLFFFYISYDDGMGKIERKASEDRGREAPGAVFSTFQPFSTIRLDRTHSSLVVSYLVSTSISHLYQYI